MMYNQKERFRDKLKELNRINNPAKSKEFIVIKLTPSW